MNLKRTAVALLCALLLIVSGVVPKAFADWYDDIKSGYSVKIAGQNFVAESLLKDFTEKHTVLMLKSEAPNQGLE